MAIVGERCAAPWSWKLIISTDGTPPTEPRAAALKSSDVPAPATVIVRDVQRHELEELIFSLSPADQSHRIASGFSSRAQLGIMESVTNPISGWKGADAPSASAKVTLTLGAGQQAASSSAVRRSTGWRGPQPTAREPGKLSKVSVIWLGVHPGTCEVSSSCQWHSLCSSWASLQSRDRLHGLSTLRLALLSCLEDVTQ